jgi:Arabinose efflux permease
MPFALLALTISAFAIGTTEFVIVGLIPTIAEQLGVTVPSAGLLVTIYALGVAIGAPVLTALTSRIPRKMLLVGLMVLFTLGNLLAWQSPSYESLVIARLLTGLAHGVFFSIGSTIATSLVAKEKAASAIAIMFGGLTVALVTGVPLGTFIGQQFGWRETFLAVSLIGAVATVASIILVPNNIKNQGSAGVREQLKVLTHPRLLLIYAITALGYGGVFTTFTFLAPMMQELAGFSAPTVSWILLAYGVAVAGGQHLGGQAGRPSWGRACVELYLCCAGRLLLVFQFTASYSIAALLTVIVMGVFAFGNVPGLQVYVVQKAAQYTPNAVDVASGLNIAAFNIGIALGSVIGGQTVASLGLAQTPWIGALIVVVALLLVSLSGRLDKKSQLQTA